MQNYALLLLGSNNNSELNLSLAQSRLKNYFCDIKFSSTFISEPIDFHSPALFSNLTALFYTDLSIEEIRMILKSIECELGREIDDKISGIVKIDIDLVRYNDVILKPRDYKRDYFRRGLQQL